MTTENCPLSGSGPEGGHGVAVHRGQHPHPKIQRKGLQHDFRPSASGTLFEEHSQLFGNPPGFTQVGFAQEA